jgi:universal stress protein F
MLAGNQTKFICISVVEKLPAFALSAVPPDLTAKAEAEARARLEEAAKSADLKASIEVRSGQAAQSILDAAKAHGADLIVVGSHAPELQDFLLGSTASRVVRHAECDVLVKRVLN